MCIKVAVVGAGSMGMNHLRVLKEFPEEQVKLVGVAEAAEPILQRAVDRFHVAGYRDYRSMVEQTRPDLIAVVVPTHLHTEVASYLIERRTHVLLEKPIASNVEEACSLVRLAQRHNVKLAIGHVERFNPAIIEVKRRLSARGLGQVFQVHARRLGPFLLAFGMWESRWIWQRTMSMSCVICWMLRCAMCMPRPSGASIPPTKMPF